ncbi:MAG: ABC transporter permease [Phycisphaerales bacterium]
MPEPPSTIRSLARSLRWPLIALALLLLFNAIVSPEMFSIGVRDGRLYGVLVDILNHGARVAIVALGMALVIAVGGVDLSVGAVAAIAGAVTATLVAQMHVPWPFAAAAALAAGALCGAWNAWLVITLRLQPIVATLILMVAGRGIAQLITDGQIVTCDNPGIAAIGNGTFLGLPVPVTILIVMAVLTALAVRRTPLGLFIESIGDSPAASRLAGVPDRAVRLVVYGTCGLLAALAGVIECSYIKAADANNAGNLLELDAILAVVIGGTSLRGGRVALAGTILGALFMQTVTKTLYMLNVSAEVAPAPKAAAVVLVCLLQSPAFRSWCAAKLKLNGSVKANGGGTP